MKYFGFIAVLCIFQSIRVTFACFGYDIEIAQLQNGQDNHINFEHDYGFELTDDCRILVGCCVTVDRPFTSAVISIKAKNNLANFFTIKNKEFCKYLLDYNISDFECPVKEAGRVCIEFAERGNISEYGPFIAFFEGNYTVLVRLDYDDLTIPDVYSAEFVIKPRNLRPVA